MIKCPETVKENTLKIRQRPVQGHQERTGKMGKGISSLLGSS